MHVAFLFMEGLAAQPSAGSLKHSASRGFAQLPRAALSNCSPFRVADIQSSQVDRPCHFGPALDTLSHIHSRVPQGVGWSIVGPVHCVTPASSLLCFHPATVCLLMQNPASDLCTFRTEYTLFFIIFVKSRTWWSNAKHKRLSWWVWSPIWTGYNKQ